MSNSEKALATPKNEDDQLIHDRKGKKKGETLVATFTGWLDDNPRTCEKEERIYEQDGTEIDHSAQDEDEDAAGVFECGQWLEMLQKPPPTPDLPDTRTPIAVVATQATAAKVAPKAVTTAAKAEKARRGTRVAGLDGGGDDNNGNHRTPHNNIGDVGASGGENVNDGANPRDGQPETEEADDVCCSVKFRRLRNLKCRPRHGFRYKFLGCYREHDGMDIIQRAWMQYTYQ